MAKSLPSGNWEQGVLARGTHTTEENRVFWFGGQHGTAESFWRPTGFGCLWTTLGYLVHQNLSFHVGKGEIRWSTLSLKWWASVSQGRVSCTLSIPYPRALMIGVLSYCPRMRGGQLNGNIRAGWSVWGKRVRVQRLEPSGPWSMRKGEWDKNVAHLRVPQGTSPRSETCRPFLLWPWGQGMILEITHLSTFSEWLGREPQCWWFL